MSCQRRRDGCTECRRKKVKVAFLWAHCKLIVLANVYTSSVTSENRHAPAAVDFLAGVNMTSISSASIQLPVHVEVSGLHPQ